MQLISVNSGIIQVVFDPDAEPILIGDFLKVTDSQNTGIIAQIYAVSSLQNTTQNVASVKILFSLDSSGKWLKWIGNTPGKEFNVQVVEIGEILYQINANRLLEPILMGTLSQHAGMELNLEKSDFSCPSAVFVDTQEEKINVNVKLANEIAKNGSKAVILDFNGEYEDFNFKRIQAGRDFKIPLNSKGIDDIYSKGLTQASPETKAVIEDIFANVKEYADSCEQGFIPVESFKNVVDAQYQQSSITELVLLKNQLTKYYENGIFADIKEQIESFIVAVENNGLVIVDMSAIPTEWHKEYIDFIVTENIKNYQSQFFLMFEGNDKNLDSELTGKICIQGVKSGIIPVISSKYETAFSTQLISFVQNFILFAPNAVTKKFSAFTNYLSMLNKNEFVLYGKATNLIPLIVDSGESVKTTFAKEEAGLVSPVEVAAQENFEFEEVKYEDIDSDMLDFSSPQEDSVIDKEETNDDDDFLDFVDGETQEQKEDIDFEDEPEEIEYNDEIDLELSNDDLDEIDEYQQYPDSTEEHYDEITKEISQDVESLYTAPNSNPEQPDQEDEQVQPKVDENRYPQSEIPVYSANAGNNNTEIEEYEIDFDEGDMVKHQKYGTGVVKKVIAYGNKKLCSIQFENVGRRLLDPELAVIQKI